MGQIAGVLKDIDGSYSSKRTLAFVSLALYGIGFLADTFAGRSVAPNLADGLMIIILGGIGSSLAERFAPKAKAEPSAAGAPPG